MIANRPAVAAFWALPAPTPADARALSDEDAALVADLVASLPSTHPRVVMMGELLAAREEEL